MLEQTLEREGPAEGREDGPILPGKGGAGWPLALQDVMEHHPPDPGDDFRLALRMEHHQGMTFYLDF